MVPKLGCRCKGILLQRTDKNQLSPLPIQLLIFLLSNNLILLGINQTSASECYWSNCIVLLFLPMSFPCLVLIALAVTILSRSLAKCARRGISVTNFFISLKSSSYFSVHSHSVFFLDSCLNRSVFSESLVRNFAKNCFAPGNNFISLVLVGGFNYKMAFIFSLLGFIRSSFLSCPKQKKMRKIPIFFSLGVYLASWSFTVNKKKFR